MARFRFQNLEMKASECCVASKLVRKSPRIAGSQGQSGLMQEV